MDAPRPTPEKRVLPVFRRMLRTSGNALQVFQACPRRGPREAQAHTAESCFHPIQRRQANEQSEHRHSHPDHRACAGHQIPRRASAGPAECHHGGERGRHHHTGGGAAHRRRCCALHRHVQHRRPCARRESRGYGQPHHGARGRSMPGPHLQSAGRPCGQSSRAGGSGALAHPPPAARL